MKSSSETAKVFGMIEDLFRRYEVYRLKLTALWPRNTPPEGFLSLSHDRPTQGSAVETLGVERAELSLRTDLVRLALRAMTRDERRFVELRYFLEVSMTAIEREMRWSKRQLYRLRTSALLKAAWVMGFLECDPIGLRKPS